MTRAPTPCKAAPPRHCPTCGTDLSPHPYYRLIPSPGARRLHRLALISLPLMSAVVVAAFIAGRAPIFFSIASGYAIVAFVCLPATLLYAVASIFPRDFRVICLRCAWFRDYAYRPGPLEALDAAQTTPLGTS